MQTSLEKYLKPALEAALRVTVGVVLGTVLTSAPLLAQAQEYPVKPIRLLIPFPPGGGTDFVSRTVGTKLAEMNKWNVVLENKPGASGNLALAETAKAAPDGYTIVMGQSDNLPLGPHLYANVGYDTVRSFAPIIQVSEASLCIVSNAQSAANPNKLANMADLVAKGKTGVGISWATAGNGSMGHLFGEQFRSAANIKLLQVPYKGAAPALTDVMGNSVDVAIMSVPSVLGHVRGGRLTALAVSTPKRSAMLPDTPTLSEAGIKGVDAGIWLGLFAPAGTPPAVIARLNSAVNQVLQAPDVREKIANGGAVAAGGASEAFAAFVREDFVRWGKIVKDAGVKLE